MRVTKQLNSKSAEKSLNSIRDIIRSITALTDSFPPVLRRDRAVRNCELLRRHALNLSTILDTNLKCTCKRKHEINLTLDCKMAIMKQTSNHLSFIYYATEGSIHPGQHWVAIDLRPQRATDHGYEKSIFSFNLRTALCALP
jgi:hypothetical protein